jgi:hypothetical protein
MKYYILTFTTLLILIIPFYSFAQDSTKAKDKKGWKWEWDDFEEWKVWKNKQPAISLNYGLSDISRKDVEAIFADNNLLELKLGYRSKQKTKYTDYIEKSVFNYLFLNRNTTNLAGGTGTTGDIETKNWQFGAGWSKEYGYKIGKDVSIAPYFTSSMNWTRIYFPNDSLNPNDERIKQLYDEAFRFGTSSEAGVRIQPVKLITFEAGYERATVFERHLFWKWAGSGIIEVAANGLLDVFIKEIFKSSPAAGPIVFFVLKSALNYGIYELRQDKMNWPFSSAPPIAIDNVTFGVTFTF